MSKHTPGPWTYECKPGYYSSWIGPDTGDSDDSTVICSMERDELIPETDRRKSPQYTYSEKQAANARLIAAAPDLLHALRQALPLIGYSAGSQEVVNLIRSTIAKATGEAT